jgi:hypothetical protein
MCTAPKSGWSAMGCDGLSLAPTPALTSLESFVEDHWKHLAAATWHGYIRFGRGALLVSPADRDAAPPEQSWILRPTYMVNTTVWTVADLLTRYDPKCSIVVLSLPAHDAARRFEDGEFERRTVPAGLAVEAGIFRYSPSPPAAYIEILEPPDAPTAGPGAPVKPSRTGPGRTCRPKNTPANRQNATSPAMTSVDGRPPAMSF